jgi:putative solute:sodium symporter small subunit
MSATARGGGGGGSPDPGRDEPDRQDPRVAAAIGRYWRRNIRVMTILLAVWAFAGLGCGVLLADRLDRFRLGGFPLGFWFAQQGSILIFVVLILVYCLALNRLDAEHHRELERIRSEPGSS